MSFDKIEGTLVYIQVQESKKAFVKPGAPLKPDEWKASVVVTDKAFVKAFQKYAKSLDTLISLKEVESSDFEETYHCELPEGAGDEVWVITFRKSTELGKTGKPVPDLYKPKVFEKVGNKYIDITQSKLVGNGSKGVISVDKFDRTSGGSSLYLKNVLVTELIEYEKVETYSPGDEFGNGSTEVDKPAAKPTSKPAPKVSKKVEDVENDNDLAPF